VKGSQGDPFKRAAVRMDRSPSPPGIPRMSQFTDNSMINKVKECKKSIEKYGVINRKNVRDPITLDYQLLKIGMITIWITFYSIRGTV
jgi:hypothetical protein